MKIFGIQKLTLIDYPGKTAATVFISGCDFFCPYCHNAESLNEQNPVSIEKQEVLDFLNTRKKLLDGVCISGGEPLNQSGIEELLKEIKSIGYEIKLDTNGNNPKLLKQLAENKLIDYIAMDIKNSLQNYAKTIGIENFNTTNVQKSAQYLQNGTTPYEFRTTIIHELHTPEDIHQIGKWLSGANKYYLQKFKNTNEVPQKNLIPPTDKAMNEFYNILTTYDINVYIR